MRGGEISVDGRRETGFLIFASSTRVKQIERCKVKIRLHAKLIAIGYNNYLSLNSVLENGHQHNSPQSQVQLEATYEFFF